MILLMNANKGILDAQLSAWQWTETGCIGDALFVIK
jgi:hypothetical protein